MFRFLLLPAAGLVLFFGSCTNDTDTAATNSAVDTTVTIQQPPPVRKGANAIDFPEDGYTQYDPVTFIGYLKENVGRGTVILQKAPKDWIQKKHIKPLVNLLDSTEPCAGITLRNSGPNPPDNVQSSVGTEALLILEAYKQNLAYPSIPSSLNFIKALQRNTQEEGKLILIPQPHQIEEAKKWAEKL